ncbi:MAG: methyltransferase domain-containing protein, partial [Actinobacteria bacterium]|nr:methyltransferase domain-containing protein [Actinomycetota bacterium]
RAHQLRDRAESFGTAAADYDRYRPTYPDALVDDLVARHPASVLDVGCGTGKAGRLLAARGLDVLGVEIDARMAEVARSHGLPVEVGAFEAWDDAGRTFDLIVSGQAWHWVDPALAVPKAARLLNPGGALVVFWNYDDVDEPAQRVIDAVYAQHVPEFADIVAAGASRREDRSYFDDLRTNGSFASIDAHTYPWTRSTPLDVWIGRVATQSNHLLLAPERLAALRTALYAGLSPLGPDVHTHGGTYTITARP